MELVAVFVVSTISVTSAPRLVRVPRHFPAPSLQIPSRPDPPSPLSPTSISSPSPQPAPHLILPCPSRSPPSAPPPTAPVPIRADRRPLSSGTEHDVHQFPLVHHQARRSLAILCQRSPKSLGSRPLPRSVRPQQRAGQRGKFEEEDSKWMGDLPAHHDGLRGLDLRLRSSTALRPESLGTIYLACKRPPSFLLTLASSFILLLLCQCNDPPTCRIRSSIG